MEPDRTRFLPKDGIFLSAWWWASPLSSLHASWLLQRRTDCNWEYTGKKIQTADW